MGKQSNEKSLAVVKNENIFYRVKMFFIKLFKGDDYKANETQVANTNEIEQPKNQSKETFAEYIRNIENDETRLLKLQKQFDNGEIDKNNLSKEKIASLTALYKKQISDLEKSNEKRINKIKQHKDSETFLKLIKNVENEETKLLKLQKQYEDGIIETKDLPKDQINLLINLYKEQINELAKSNERRKQKLLIYRNKMQNA